MDPSSFNPSIKVLIIPFGTYRQFLSSPSQKISSLLPSLLTHHGTTIQILRPNEPMKSEYSHIITTIPKLIEDYNPDIVIGVGQDELAKDFMIERGARRDVYFEFPDNARKTLTRGETKKRWKGCEERLETNLDLETVLERWRRNYSGSKKAKGKVPGMGRSEDAGNYVCGCLYFAVLAYLKGKGDERTKAVFLHVPPLRTEEEVGIGEKVVEGLIKAVVEGCEV